MMLVAMISYTQVADERIIKAILANGHIPAKAISLFSHVLNAQHIWAHRIVGKTPQYSVWQEHLPESFLEIAGADFKMLNEILQVIDPEVEISYAKSDGQHFSNSVQDILFHVVNHSTYHRAQIASLLKAIAIEPPVTDYIILKREMQL